MRDEADGRERVEVMWRNLSGMDLILMKLNASAESFWRQRARFSHKSCTRLLIEMLFEERAFSFGCCQRSKTALKWKLLRRVESSKRDCLYSASNVCTLLNVRVEKVVLIENVICRKLLTLCRMLHKVDFQIILFLHKHNDHHFRQLLADANPRVPSNTAYWHHDGARTR